MTQKQDGTRNLAPRINFTEKDVDRMVESYADTHPEFAGSEQARALKQALIENKIGELIRKPKSNEHLLTNIATTLSGSAALALVAAALAPELPVVTGLAAVAGVIVSLLAARKVDEASE
jgi:hypothetical protein